MEKEKIYILIPTRDRPEIVWRLIDSWLRERDNNGDSELIIIVDSDQKELYHKLFEEVPIGVNVVIIKKGYKLVPKLNIVANGVMGGDFGGVLGLGFMGDDCVFRTHWEAEIVKQLKESKGLAYANDLLKGEEIPNNVFIHKDIIEKLGFMCPKVLQHYYIDNYWKDLGIKIHNIRYFPNIIIEHMHHSNGKAQKDDLYKRSEVLLDIDKLAYDDYLLSGKMQKDVDKILEN